MRTTRPALDGGSRSSSSSNGGGILSDRATWCISKHSSKRNDEINESMSNFTVTGAGKHSKSSPGRRAGAIRYPNVSTQPPMGVNIAAAAAPFQSFETETSNGTGDDRSPGWHPAVTGHPGLSTRTLVGVDAATAAAATTAAAPLNSFDTGTSLGTSYGRSYDNDDDVIDEDDADDSRRSLNGTTVDTATAAAAAASATAAATAAAPFNSFDTGTSTGTSGSRSYVGGLSDRTYPDDDGHQAGETRSRQTSSGRRLNGSWNSDSEWRWDRASISNPYRLGAVNNNGRANRSPRFFPLFRPGDRRPLRGANVGDGRNRIHYVINNRTVSGSAPGSQSTSVDIRQPQQLQQHPISSTNASTGDVDDAGSHTAGSRTDRDDGPGNYNTGPAKTRKVGNVGDSPGGQADVTDAPPSTSHPAKTLPSAMEPIDANGRSVEVAGAAATLKDASKDAGSNNLQRRTSTTPRYRRGSTTPATTSPNLRRKKRSISFGRGRSLPLPRTGSFSMPKVKDGPTATWRLCRTINDTSSAKIGPRRSSMSRAWDSSSVRTVSDNPGSVCSSPEAAAAVVLSVASGDANGTGTSAVKEPAPAWARSAGLQQQQQQQLQHPYPILRKKPPDWNSGGSAGQAAVRVGRSGDGGSGGGDGGGIGEVGWSSGGAQAGQEVPVAGGKAAVVCWRGPRRQTVSLIC